MIKLILPDGTETDYSDRYKGAVPFAFFTEITNGVVPRGYVERVVVIEPGWKDLDYPQRANMLVHESGRIEGLPFNEKASEIYWAWPLAKQGATRERLREEAPIVGPALLLTLPHTID